MAGAKGMSSLGVAWSDGALGLRVEVDDAGVARLACLSARQVGEVPDWQAPVSAPNGLPLVDIVTTGTGKSWSGRRYAHSGTGGRLKYVGHEERDAPPWHEIKVALEDPASGLAVEVTYRVLVGHGVLRSSVRLANQGRSPVTVESVTSFVGSGLAGPSGNLDDVDILWADNEWFGEDRWHTRAFRDALPDLGLESHRADPRGMYGFTSEGSWSSGTYLPMGAAQNRRTGHTWLWQIEHNGPWHWQVGERSGKEAYLALLGPTYWEHDWRLVLGVGESFETVPVAVAVSAGGLEGAVAAMTHYRRAIRRPHEDNRRLPVIFNDYMNTLMGDPTTERLLPLIDAAARAGAEYFCIDAGWYAELGETWWDSVGAWSPSRSRFPQGIEEVLGHIRGRGMVPGLWLEPEVVGVRSPVAEKLPAEAFFSRGGQRVVEHGRYQLDFSHPAARQHLDSVVDHLVGELGVGYLKMDYNINIGPGTERGEMSAGAGLLAHNRAFLQWADQLLARHKALTIESCASGAMRKDYATLSMLQLQSTSDQQNFLLYPAISVAVPVAVAPEQAAVWAYPQPGWKDDEVTFTLCNALLGRVHLSGHLDKMSEAELGRVAEGVAVYKQIRGDLAQAVPFWPFGLPGWADSWFSLGMRSAGATYLVVWHRSDIGPWREDETAAGPAPLGPFSPGTGVALLPIAHLKGKHVAAQVLYPSHGSASVEWHAAPGELVVSLPSTPSACLVALT